MNANNNKGRGAKKGRFVGSKRKNWISAAVNPANTPAPDDLDSALSLASAKRVFIFDKAKAEEPK
jgi:hypothetical protein